MAAPAEAQRRALGLVMGVVESTQTRARQPDSEVHSGLMVGAWVDQQTPVPWLSVTAEAFLVRRGARYILDDGFARQLDVDYVGAALLPSLRASAGPASLVGYGTERASSGSKLDYWIVQLPWGSAWGEHGYARVLRGKSSLDSAAVVIEPMV